MVRSSPLSETGKTRYIYNMKNETALIATATRYRATKPVRYVVPGRGCFSFTEGQIISVSRYRALPAGKVQGSFEPVAKGARVSNKVVPWTAKDFDLLIALYLKWADPANSYDGRKEIEVDFLAQKSNRTKDSVGMAVGQIVSLDDWHPGDGFCGTSQMLCKKLYEADPVRFAAAGELASGFDSKLDSLIASICA